MGSDGTILVILWAVGPGVRGCVDRRHLSHLPQLFIQGLRVGTVEWNHLLGACVPTDSRAEYIVLLGAFSIYST